jgi:hypothetical protein
MKKAFQIAGVLFYVIFLAGCDRDLNAGPPVSFTYTGSWVGAGIVLSIQNISSVYIDNLTITIERDGRVIKTAGIADKLGPGESISVGWMEIGVTIQKTDDIILHAKGYITGTKLVFLR